MYAGYFNWLLSFWQAQKRNLPSLMRERVKDLSDKLEFVGQLARVSERNLKARETGGISIARGGAASL